MFRRGLRKFHAHALFRMHDSHHTLRPHFHRGRAHRQRHSARRRKRRRNLQVASAQAQIRKLASNRRIILLRVRRILFQPLPQLAASLPARSAGIAVPPVPPCPSHANSAGSSSAVSVPGKVNTICHRPVRPAPASARSPPCRLRSGRWSSPSCCCPLPSCAAPPESAPQPAHCAGVHSSSTLAPPENSTSPARSIPACTTRSALRFRTPPSVR